MPNVINQTAVFGKRFTSEEAVSSGLVHKQCTGQSLLREAIETAKSLTDKQQYDRTHLHNMKQDIYGKVLTAGRQARVAGLQARI